jgi:ribonuclease BN (tRNA processing enzyme)
MQVQVLGCSGAIARGCRTTSFLLDDDVLIDAGTGVGDLAVEALGRIDHVLLSHSHLDHVLAVGLLADTVSRTRTQAGRAPITVHALPQTLEALRAHVLNDVIWPDFCRLPSASAPTLRLQAFDVGQRLDFGAGRSVTILPAAHSVPAVGFALQLEDGPAWVFSGDTGPNPKLWAALQDMPLGHLVIEVAFSDAERALAAISGHLHPALLPEELAALPRGTEVLITHVKPGEGASVMAEIQALRLPCAPRALAIGDRFALRAASPADPAA